MYIRVEFSAPMKIWGRLFQYSLLIRPPISMGYGVLMHSRCSPNPYYLTNHILQQVNKMCNFFRDFLEIPKKKYSN